MIWNPKSGPCGLPAVLDILGMVQFFMPHRCILFCAPRDLGHSEFGPLKRSMNAISLQARVARFMARQMGSKCVSRYRWGGLPIGNWISHRDVILIWYGKHIENNLWTFSKKSKIDLNYITQLPVLQVLEGILFFQEFLT